MVLRFHTLHRHILEERTNLALLNLTVSYIITAFYGCGASQKNEIINLVPRVSTVLIAKETMGTRLGNYRRTLSVICPGTIGTSFAC